MQNCLHQSQVNVRQIGMHGMQKHGIHHMDTQVLKLKPGDDSCKSADTA